jgi:hypothetical protein
MKSLVAVQIIPIKAPVKTKTIPTAARARGMNQLVALKAIKGLARQFLAVLGILAIVEILQIQIFQLVRLILVVLGQQALLIVIHLMLPIRALVRRILDVFGMAMTALVLVNAVGNTMFHVRAVYVGEPLTMEIVAVILEQDVLVVQETVDYSQALGCVRLRQDALGVQGLQ